MIVVHSYSILSSCIDGITAFVEPLLDLVCAHTGMVAYAEFGGPEPADGGRLNVIRLVLCQ